MVVNSYGRLANLSTVSPRSSEPAYEVGVSTSYRSSYATIYRTQPYVRICVDFLARNLAQLGLHVFRRVSDTDRERLTADQHGLAYTLNYPNPATTRYRLIESTAQDFFIYFNAYWVKVRTPGALGVVRIPAGEVEVTGGLIPDGYIWTSTVTGEP